VPDVNFVSKFEIRDLCRSHYNEEKESSMRVVLGSDHAGFVMKQQILEYVRGLGHEVLDAGAFDSSASDYPDYAEALALALLDKRADRGIMICGSGVGASVALNKIPGIRAGLSHDCYSAHQGVEHDDVNVLVMGARVIGIELARDLASVFLKAAFSGEDRHMRRIAKVRQLEKKYR
jgi:RpiB/LacA/LacB family sugar-phosphate isomerase